MKVVINSKSCFVDSEYVDEDSDSLIVEVGLSCYLMVLFDCVVLLSIIILDFVQPDIVSTNSIFKHFHHRHFDLRNSYFYNFRQVFFIHNF